MGGNEIHGQIPLPAILQEGSDPLAVAGGRAADFDFGIDLLDREHGGFIKLKILIPGSVPEGAGQIRFIPDLKEPGADFLRAVAVNQETDEGLHVHLPGFPVRRGHDDGLIEEGTPLYFTFLLPCQLARHKGKLHEGLHARFQHIVIGNAAGIEVVLLKSFAAWEGILHGEVVEGPHVITEDAVEANPLDAEGIMDELQLADIIRPEGE